MRILLVIVLLLLSGASPASWDNFNENPYTLYPPGCSANLEETELLTAGRETLVRGEIEADSLGATVPVLIEIARLGCADSNRSLLILTLEVVETANGENDLARIPTFYLVTDDKVGRLRVTRDPNTNRADITGNFIFESEGPLTFYLDSVTPFQADFPLYDAISPGDFNDGFTLEVIQQVAPDYDIDISDYRNELRPSSMPLNGRHSGVWVSNGARDQGFVISFSELAEEFEDGVIFFSWYTFDVEGKNIWLVGNTSFAHGDTSVGFELQWVSNGSFLGDQQATRIPAGSATITARSCSGLELDYVLEPLGLGSGTVQLKRSFKLETMGYNCMDSQTRKSVPN